MSVCVNIESWLCDELRKFGIDASLDTARYILQIETSKELEEYMLEFLDVSGKIAKEFIDDLIAKWQLYHNAEDKGSMPMFSMPKLEDIIGNERNCKELYKDKNSRESYKEKKNAKKNIVINGYDVENRGILPGEEKPSQDLPAPKKSHQDKDVKKKQKFVPLYSKEGQVMSVIILPGRHACECQAAKHKLINNCTKCGRVVCEQERSGPCLFCGNLVCTVKELEILSRGSKKSEKLHQSLMKNSTATTALLGKHLFNGDTDFVPTSIAVKINEGYVQAEKHKDKLLEYDKTSARRTKVIDDEADYFSTDSDKWLTTNDRELLRKREEELRSLKYASRKERKITFDFAGRQVIEEDPATSVDLYNVNDDVIQKVHYGARPKDSKGANYVSQPVMTDDSYLVNPNINTEPPQFVPQALSKSQRDSPQPVVLKVPSRIQDRELHEMSDEGMCMSMHQPWASLLVLGIKKHEGRTWYTTHRGRLWIAATAKAPDPANIADTEQAYKYLYKNPHLKFPDHYPVGCLLGCVDVIDCLPEDNYKEQFPDGESSSPFVFICDNAHELLVKFPIKGKFKIYKLESHIHKAAKKGLK